MTDLDICENYYTKAGPGCALTSIVPRSLFEGDSKRTKLLHHPEDVEMSSSWRGMHGMIFAEQENFIPLQLRHALSLQSVPFNQIPRYRDMCVSSICTIFIHEQKLSRRNIKLQKRD